MSFLTSYRHVEKKHSKVELEYLLIRPLPSLQCIRTTRKYLRQQMHTPSGTRSRSAVTVLIVYVAQDVCVKELRSNGCFRLVLSLLTAETGSEQKLDSATCARIAWTCGRKPPF